MDPQAPISATPISTPQSGNSIDANQVNQWRSQGLTDDAIMHNVYHADDGFKQKVDSMQPFYNQQDPSWQEQFPHWAINKYFNLEQKNENSSQSSLPIIPPADPATQNQPWFSQGQDLATQSKKLAETARASLGGFSNENIWGKMNQNGSQDFGVGKAITAPFKIASNFAGNVLDFAKTFFQPQPGAAMPDSTAGKLLLPLQNAARTVFMPLGSAEVVADKALGTNLPDIGGLKTQALNFANYVADKYGLHDAAQGDFAAASQKLLSSATERPAEAYVLGKMAQAGLAGGAEMMGAPGAASTIQDFNPAAPVEQLGKLMYRPAAATADFMGNMGIRALGGAALVAPRDIMNVYNDPQRFGAAQTGDLTLNSVAGKLQSALDAKEAELSSTGKAYDAIRKAPGTVDVPRNELRTQVFDKYGISFDSDGSLITNDANSILSKASAGDINAIQKFADIFTKDPTLSNNAYLNGRNALDQLAAWGSDKTSVSSTIAKSLRAVWDEAGKDQIDGLKELDGQYAPQVEKMQNLRSTYLEDGQLKPSAQQKIWSAATSQFKDADLAELENLVPGVGKDIRVLRSLRNISSIAEGQMGNSSRLIAAAFEAGHGNLPVAAGIILTAPQFVIPLVKWFGTITGHGEDMLPNIITKMGAGVDLSPVEGAYVSKAMSAYDMQ